MKTKTVYLYDALTGSYAGTYEAHESPLETGVFHTPTDSTGLEPPDFNRAVSALNFIAGAWVVVPLPVKPPTVVIPLTYSQLRAIEYAKRNQFEMQYDDAKLGTTTWVDWQDGIKAAIPKPPIAT